MPKANVTCLDDGRPAKRFKLNIAFRLIAPIESLVDDGESLPKEMMTTSEVRDLAKEQLAKFDDFFGDTPDGVELEALDITIAPA